MKKLMSLSMIAIFAMAMMLVSCGKYDEGPKFSLASKKGRVVNVWKQEAAFVNGTEQTADPDWANESMEFTKDGKIISTYVSGGVTTTSDDGTWDFDSKKESIVFTSTSGGISFSFTYKILRLKSNEMWLEFTSGTDKYESHFVTK